MPSSRTAAFGPIVVALLLAACAPNLDWREVRPEGSGAVALFPCKPSAQTRTVRLAGGSATMTLLACTAGGTTWALAHADLADATRVGPALGELRIAAAANLGTSTAAEMPMKVPGATPNPAARRIEIVGHLPDGNAVREQVAVFSRGTQVFQATALGERPGVEALESFFGSLRLQ
jgi:hypothetical protein